MTALEKFLGKGIIFPIQLTNGKPDLTSGPDLIKASLFTILQWSFGTRWYLGEFGSKVEELIEEPNDIVLQGLMKHYIIDAISKQEKRVELISAVIQSMSYNRVDIKLTYRITNSKIEDTMVYPFYRQINT